jgi:hypothetical protein
MEEMHPNPKLMNERIQEIKNKYYETKDNQKIRLPEKVPPNDLSKQSPGVPSPKVPEIDALKLSQNDEHERLLDVSHRLRNLISGIDQSTKIYNASLEPLQNLASRLRGSNEKRVTSPRRERASSPARVADPPHDKTQYRIFNEIVKRIQQPSSVRGVQ